MTYGSRKNKRKSLPEKEKIACPFCQEGFKNQKAVNRHVLKNESCLNKAREKWPDLGKPKKHRINPLVRSIHTGLSK